MDRYEVPIDAHLAPLVEAAERGEEVVITRGGRVVAAISAASVPADRPGRSITEGLAELRKHTRGLPGMTLDEVRQLVRDARDEGF